MQALGRQMLVELYDCDRDLLNSQEFIRNAMIAAVEKAKATIVASTFHHFSPHGVSGVVVIAESHVAVHTWPEYGYAAVDVFTCGESIDPWIIHTDLKDTLQSSSTSVTEIKRGLFDIPGKLAHKAC